MPLEYYHILYKINLFIQNMFANNLHFILIIFSKGLNKDKHMTTILVEGKFRYQHKKNYTRTN